MITQNYTRQFMFMSISAKKSFLLIFCLCFFYQVVRSQDESLIFVHFLYGSKPSKQHKETEGKWFGGRLGGHVGIETGNDSVLNFTRQGKLHLFSSARHRNSRYVINTTNDFWGIFRTNGSAVKKTTIGVPISKKQKQVLDSVLAVYVAQTPYDYAFFGMRCGAATYDILAQLGIMRSLSRSGTYMKIFYPRKLRKRLLKMARQNNWEVILKEGAITRRWEQD
jgi:hypothetical protein